MKEETETKISVETEETKETKDSKEVTDPSESNFHKEFEFAQMLREINPHFRRGVVPINPAFYEPQPAQKLNFQNVDIHGVQAFDTLGTIGSMYQTDNWGYNNTFDPYLNRPYPEPQPATTAPYTFYPYAGTQNWNPGAQTPYLTQGYPNTQPMNGMTYESQGTGTQYSGNPAPMYFGPQKTGVPYFVNKVNVPYPISGPTNTNGEVGRQYVNSASYWPHSMNSAFAGPFIPPANIMEYENQFTIELLIPGFSEEDCKIKFSNGVLWIYGARETENTESPEKFHTTNEFVCKSFRRLFMISEDVDIEKTTTLLKEGILTIAIGKKDLVSQQEKKVSELHPS